MKALSLQKVEIVNRQRRHFDEKALIKLADSIRAKGLLHPIVLQDDSVTLVAGERRFRAIAMLAELGVDITCDGQTFEAGTIPYVNVRSLSADDLVEAELEENILREDLTWQEEAEAIDRLHQLRTIQTDGAQTFKATAQELVGDHANAADQVKVREATIINQHLTDPDVLKAKNKKEALKIIKRKAEQKLTNTLAEQFDIQETPHIFNNGDFRDFYHFIDTSSVDTIITDPPYGIDADSFGDQAGATHEYDDTVEYFQEIMRDFIVEASRVTRDRAHMYLFCDPRRFDYLSELATVHGWSVWPTPLIWSKGNGMLPKPDFGPRRTYEFILFANKGDKPVTAVYGDVINVQGLKQPRYGAEKPPALFEDLMRRSCRPGDRIWDAFVGAGPIFPAANRLSLQVVGTELSTEKYNFAKLRLAELEVLEEPEQKSIEEIIG